MAEKVKHEMKLFGDVRIDNYYWLRDDSRKDPKVLAYLEQENAYTEAMMSGTKKFEDKIYAEIRGRIKEDDISAPSRKGPYYYYSRTLEGKEYVQYCRRPVCNCNAPPSVHDTMPTGPCAPPEHVILDENVKAQEHGFYNIGAFTVSPNHKMVAYAEDTKGDEIYTIYVIDAETRAQIGKPLVGTTSDVQWAGNDALVYITMDEIHRSDKLGAWLHKLGSDQCNDSMLYHEKDDMFSLGLQASESENFLFISSGSAVTSFVFYLEVCKLDEGLKVLTPRIQGIDTSFFSFSVKIQDIKLFRDHLVVYEREQALPKITVYIFRQLKSHSHAFKGSLRTPPSVYEYDMNTEESVLKKTETVLVGFDASNYVTERKWAMASDGTQITISIVYHKNLVKLDGSDPMLLYGYGSYEISVDPDFDKARLSLLDHGFVFAIAHVRGGGEMGRQWYDNGKFLKKKNTFTDFITCAEFLIEQNYCSKKKLCIEGRSAGGMLMGAVLNMRPDLWKAVVAGVPFVDVVTTMLDPTIPLTTSEWEEWGDPRKEEFYHYMKSYSPVDNVKAQNYPHILVTAGLHDPRVMYSEPAKFVAKLRDVKTDDNMLLFKCELGAGHFSKSGRFERLQEDAMTFAFLLKALNMIPTCG
ncbi:Prolyl oligopeptidase family protein isoform 2 [Hibiscus syriacus]|uniref:Prolyl endopeptidase n=1 Tax=Hibiscus syriacus TaxID=106335 RepID=A0A6A2WN54_HIBSY|nr:Prolyl oligopeptidase family protein isoform 2 [Hibiscus syriacus]